MVEKRSIQGGESIRVGLRDGRILPLSTCGSRTRARIGHVRRGLRQSDRKPPTGTQSAGKSHGGTRVELRVRPTVQGVAVVLENRTGRVLAMAGGFSYPLSQLNRVTQSRRQPGSSFKPMTYLAALNSGLQPNTLVDDAPITYPPIGGANAIHAPRGLLVAAQLRRRLLRHDDDAPRAGAFQEPGDGAPARRRHRQRAEPEPRRDLQARRSRRMSIRNASGTIRSCSAPSRCGRSTSPAFYAAIANEGKRPTPHVIEQITQDGREVYKADERPDAARRGRSGRGVPAPFDAARRGGARHRRALELAVDLHRRQDRHQRRFQRRLVRELQQRHHRRGLGRLRQRQGQAHARPWPGRIEGRDPDLRADHAHRLGELRAADAAAEAFTRSGAPSDRAADRRAIPASGSTAAAATRASMSAAPAPAARQRRVHGIFPARRQRPPQRHAGAPDLARPRLRRIWRRQRQSVLRRQSVPVAGSGGPKAPPGFGFPRHQSGPFYNEAPDRDPTLAAGRRTAAHRHRHYSPADRSRSSERIEFDQSTAFTGGTG